MFQEPQDLVVLVQDQGPETFLGVLPDRRKDMSRLLGGPNVRNADAVVLLLDQADQGLVVRLGFLSPGRGIRVQILVREQVALGRALGPDRLPRLVLKVLQDDVMNVALANRLLCCAPGPGRNLRLEVHQDVVHIVGQEDVAIECDRQVVRALPFFVRSAGVRANAADIQVAITTRLHLPGELTDVGDGVVDDVLTDTWRPNLALIENVVLDLA